jgi:hypothetical protein
MVIPKGVRPGSIDPKKPREGLPPAPNRALLAGE